MKSITIDISQGEEETPSQYNLELITTVNGPYYHDCLKGICDVLVGYDKRKKLSPKEKALLEDIRKKTSMYFRGVYHASTK